MSGFHGTLQTSSGPAPRPSRCSTWAGRGRADRRLGRAPGRPPGGGNHSDDPKLRAEWERRSRPNQLGKSGQRRRRGSCSLTPSPISPPRSRRWSMCRTGGHGGGDGPRGQAAPAVSVPRRPAVARLTWLRADLRDLGSPLGDVDDWSSGLRSSAATGRWRRPARPSCGHTHVRRPARRLAGARSRRPRSGRPVGGDRATGLITFAYFCWGNSPPPAE